MDRLSGDFNRGYTKAIQDIIEHVEQSNADLRYHHKRMNEKLIISFLKCFLVNREKFREDWKGWFIRWNGQLNDWEIFQDIRVRKDDEYGRYL